MATIVIGQDDIVGQWVGDRVGKLWYPGAGRCFGWVNRDGALIAGVALTNFDGTNIVIDCAAEEKARWADRRALWCVFSYIFEQLKCVRATSFVPADNEKAIKFNLSAGLELETKLERAAPNGQDMLVFRAFREDCKWLCRETQRKPKQLQLA